MDQFLAIFMYSDPIFIHARVFISRVSEGIKYWWVEKIPH